MFNTLIKIKTFVRYNSYKTDLVVIGGCFRGIYII